MKNSDKNSFSSQPGDTMMATSDPSAAAAAAVALGLTPMGETGDRVAAFRALSQRLRALSLAQPELEIQQQVEEAMAAGNRLEQFIQLFNKYRSQIEEMETTV